SVQYRTLVAEGQAYEYTNYMLPVELDGSRVILAGIRESEAVPFRYVRIPVGDDDTVEEFMSLRAALEEPAVVSVAAQRFAEKNATETVDAARLQKAAVGALESFRQVGFDGVMHYVHES